jgi:hypothetical protein
MATFASITFSERGKASGTFFPIHGARCRYAILPCPGGVKVYLQILGADAAPLDVPARVTAAQLASLRGKVGQSGTLAYAGGSTSATLTEVTPEEIKKDVDMYFVTLKFLI